ncbi:MAG: helix-turn-helix transcriptional regulator [Pseudohongiella sp.]|uniref:helix-turn-helix domain-containing protein n=1 Tax=Pseudohongiella sp. TaxID=1979412 RepID=UPI0034A0A6E7
MKKTLHSPDYQKLTEWLKHQRKAKGMSMRDLGEKLDISHSFVAKIEQRERRLDVIEYTAYCKALGVSPLDGLMQIGNDH